MSQNAISSWGGRRKLPYAFTEQGIYMLMMVLKGELAIKQSKALIRLFKRMKEYILENQYIVGPNDFYHLSHRVDLLSEENKMIREEMKNFATKNDINKIETELNVMMDNFIDESKYKHFLIIAVHLQKIVETK